MHPNHSQEADTDHLKIRAEDTVSFSERVAARHDDADAAYHAHVARELAGRDRVIGLLSRSDDILSILGDVLDTVLGVVERPAGGVYLVDEHRSHLPLVASRNIPARLAHEFYRRPLRVGQGLAGEVVLRGEPVVSERFPDDMVRSEVRSLVTCQVSICVPIKSTTGVIGVLAVFDPEARAVQSDEIAFLRGVGLQLGLMLENARRAQVEQLKDDFLSLVSHELRTPATTVRAGISTFRRYRHALDEDVQEQLLTDVAEESERLHLLIEDLLSLTALQRGTVVRTEPVSARHLIDHVLTALRHRTARHDVRTDIPPGLPSVEAEPAYFQQVVRNLLMNALKYSPECSEIVVTAEAGEDEVVFSVLDRGEGIPPEDIQRIFQPFYRAPKNRLFVSGAGLGLTVCQRLLEVQSGRIWAEPREGGGTAFHFTLPISS